MSEYTFETAALKAVTIDAVKYNEEGLQNSMPIAWSKYTTSAPTVSGTTFSYAIGIGASVFGAGSISIGSYANANSAQSIVLGYSATAEKANSVSIGGRLTDSSGNTFSNTSQAPQTVVIGNGAQILNPKNDDGSPVLDNNGKQIVSSNSVTIGTGAVCNNLDSVVIGANAKNTNSSTDTKTGIAIGAGATVLGGGSNLAIGTNASASGLDVSIGCEARATGGKSVVVGSRSINNGAQQTTILGTAAKITNITAADGTIIRSENSTVIGYGASASAPNAVVLGAGASTVGKNTVVIGAGSKLLTDTGTVDNTVVIGTGVTPTIQHTNSSVFIGSNITAEGNICVAIGTNSSVGSAGIAVGASAKAKVYSTAIGYRCANTNNGVTAFRQQYSTGETYTQFYIMAAGSALAAQYEEGEACMGYVVKNVTTGELVAAGTQKLSVLFPNNSTFQPATVDENGEWVMPKVFHPSDLDLPIEEPTEPKDMEINIPEPELEEYQPLPVYPIVEHEIQDEPDEYEPLPVYPIVEPEIEEINE